VLGRHEFGSSDPALWKPEVLGAVRTLEKLFNTQDAPEAVRREVAGKQYARAMLGARLAVAHGHPQGELLTDEILEEAHIRDHLPELRRSPWRREEFLGDDGVPSLDPRAPFLGERPACYRCRRELEETQPIRFYDDRFYCPGCLDEAGGKGFAAMVRDEPVLVRRAPSPVWVTILLVGMTALILVPGGLAALEDKDSMWEALGGVGLMAFLLGWLGLIPVVAVSVVDGEQSWPRGGKGVGDIERAIRAAVAMRVS
jgi:hypothetical protein